jgi:hypothetical protein
MVLAKPIACLFVIIFFVSLPSFAGPVKPPTAAEKISAAAPAVKPSPKAYSSIGLGLISWAEQLDIVDSAFIKNNANAVFYTPSLHYGRRMNNFDNKSFGTLLEGYAFVGSADVQADSPTLVYFQRRVPVFGFGGVYGWYYHPDESVVNIGFSIPMQYRVAKWTVPTGISSVSNGNVFAMGLNLDMRWRLTPGFAVTQRIGAFLGYRSASWMMCAEWTL